MRSGIKTKLNTTRRSANALEFEAALRRKIVGQDSAISRMTEAYRGSPNRDLTFINSKQCGRFVPFSHASDQNRGRSILTTRVMRG